MTQNHSKVFSLWIIFSGFFDDKAFMDRFKPLFVLLLILLLLGANLFFYESIKGQAFIIMPQLLRFSPQGFRPKAVYSFSSNLPVRCEEVFIQDLSEAPKLNTQELMLDTEKSKNPLASLESFLRLLEENREIKGPFSDFFFQDLIAYKSEKELVSFVAKLNKATGEGTKPMDPKWLEDFFVKSFKIHLYKQQKIQHQGLRHPGQLRLDKKSLKDLKGPLRDFVKDLDIPDQELVLYMSYVFAKAEFTDAIRNLGLIKDPTRIRRLKSFLQKHQPAVRALTVLSFHLPIAVTFHFPNFILPIHYKKSFAEGLKKLSAAEIEHPAFRKELLDDLKKAELKHDYMKYIIRAYNLTVAVIIMAFAIEEIKDFILDPEDFIGRSVVKFITAHFSNLENIQEYRQQLFEEFLLDQALKGNIILPGTDDYIILEKVFLGPPINENKEPME